MTRARNRVKIPCAEIIPFPGAEQAAKKTKPSRSGKPETNYHQIGFDAASALIDAMFENGHPLWVFKAMEGLFDKEEENGAFWKGIQLRYSPDVIAADLSKGDSEC